MVHAHSPDTAQTFTAVSPSVGMASNSCTNHPVPAGPHTVHGAKRNLPLSVQETHLTCPYGIMHLSRGLHLPREVWSLSQLLLVKETTGAPAAVGKAAPCRPSRTGHRCCPT
jgi:hypothetical protein